MYMLGFVGVGGVVWGGAVRCGADCVYSTAWNNVENACQACGGTVSWRCRLPAPASQAHAPPRNDGGMIQSVSMSV